MAIVLPFLFTIVFFEGNFQGLMATLDKSFLRV